LAAKFGQRIQDLAAAAKIRVQGLDLQKKRSEVMY
jgi:hypothetical protein